MSANSAALFQVVVVTSSEQAYAQAAAEYECEHLDADQADADQQEELPLVLDELLHFARAPFTIQTDCALADAGDEPTLLIAFGCSQCDLTTGCWHLEVETYTY